MANARRTPSWARIVMWVVVGVLALLAIKWVLITVVLLAVPFGVWWVVDRTRRAPAVPGFAPSLTPVPARTPAPMTVPVPRHPSRW